MDFDGYNLTPCQKKFLELWLLDPRVPKTEIAQQMGINTKTVYNWMSDNDHGFKDALDEHLENQWQDALHVASDSMFSLAREGDFRASKYILDHFGYAPKDKVESEGTIKIVVEGEENEKEKED